MYRSKLIVLALTALLSVACAAMAKRGPPTSPSVGDSCAGLEKVEAQAWFGCDGNKKLMCSGLTKDKFALMTDMFQCDDDEQCKTTDDMLIAYCIDEAHDECTITENPGKAPTVKCTRNTKK